MADIIVKVYQNTSKSDLNVNGVGVIPAGETVSIASEFQPPVVLANFPGLIDVTNTAPLDTTAANQNTISGGDQDE